METMVKAEGIEERNVEDSRFETYNSTLSSPRRVADPVVYKLVRVDGDGRFVPAADDEVMEVENSFEDDKSKMCVVVDTRQNEDSSSIKPQFDISEGVFPGLLRLENTEADEEKISVRFEYIEEMLQRVKEEERIRLSCGSPEHDSLLHIEENFQAEPPLQEIIVHKDAPSTSDSQITQSGSIEERSKHQDQRVEGGSSPSVFCTSSNPDFSMLKGEICMNSLSIKELHELFRATFGRETTVKDKSWLKRRISMGLTNSCDIPVISNFIIKYGKLVKEDKEESSMTMDNTLTSQSSENEDQQNDSSKRLRSLSVELECGSEDHMEQRGAKRIRKPTRRYIEELSEGESKDSSQRVISSNRHVGGRQTFSKSDSRPVKSISLDGRTVITRLDSLGGSGVHVPCVSRLRRSRPRKNIKALMKFDQSGLGLAARLVKKAYGPWDSKINSDSGDEDLKARSAPEKQHSLIAPSEKDKAPSPTGSVEHGPNLGPKTADSSADTSYDTILPIPQTVKGGIRRKHHRAWTLAEVVKLVEGVAEYGAGRWSEIKRLAFASYSYRTSVDLKDKWRNLLKASFSPTPPDEAINSRKNVSAPIPSQILIRVRELAEMQDQALPPNLISSRKISDRLGGGSVPEEISGRLGGRSAPEEIKSGFL